MRKHQLLDYLAANIVITSEIILELNTSILTSELKINSIYSWILTSVLWELKFRQPVCQEDKVLVLQLPISVAVRRIVQQ